ncbi:hypothetical protein HN011_001089 [Eciton burchellii]|nr:hypothetical protein HN011_001089 [Eciton burchellii]
MNNTATTTPAIHASTHDAWPLSRRRSAQPDRPRLVDLVGCDSSTSTVIVPSRDRRIPQRSPRGATRRSAATGISRVVGDQQRPRRPLNASLRLGALAAARRWTVMAARIGSGAGGKLLEPSARQRPVSQHPSSPDRLLLHPRMRARLSDLSIHRSAQL